MAVKIVNIPLEFPPDMQEMLATYVLLRNDSCYSSHLIYVLYSISNCYTFVASYMIIMHIYKVIYMTCADSYM